jgi:hypothetical protein
LDKGASVRDTERISSFAAETVHDDVESDRVLVGAKVRSLLVVPPSDLLIVRLAEAVMVVDCSKEALREAPVNDEDWPSDHAAVDRVPLTVAKVVESVDDTVGCGSHNCIIAEMSVTAPDSVTGFGVCTERATSDASFT